jgi:DNA-binding IclR family transcriptional regulator
VPAGLNGSTGPRWDVLTNHGYVLLAVAENPTARVRDLAMRVGITERAAYRILADLIHAGYMTSRRNGRRNVYTVHMDQTLSSRCGMSVRELVSITTTEGP